MIRLSRRNANCGCLIRFKNSVLWVESNNELGTPMNTQDENYVPHVSAGNQRF